MRTLAIATILLAAACSTDAREQSQAPVSSQAVLTGARPHKMHRCPSAVPAAITKVTAVDDGVELTITSTDLTSQHDIVALAGFQSRIGEAWWFLPQHSELHGGPGNIGFCPIIHRNTDVSVTPIPDGVRIHVKARAAADVKPLQDATSTRLRALTMPSS